VLKGAGTHVRLRIQYNSGCGKEIYVFPVSFLVPRGDEHLAQPLSVPVVKVIDAEDKCTEHNQARDLVKLEGHELASDT